MSVCIKAHHNEISTQAVPLPFIYSFPGAVKETSVVMSSLLYLATACTQHRVVTQSRIRKAAINTWQFTIGCMIIGLLTFSWIALKLHSNCIGERMKVMAATVSVFSTVSLGSSLAILCVYTYVLWWLKQHAVHSIMAPTWTKSLQKIIIQMAVIGFTWLPACCLQTYSAVDGGCLWARVATTAFLCLHALTRLASMPVIKRCSRTTPLNIYNIAYEKENRTKINGTTTNPRPVQIKVSPLTAASSVELDTCTDISVSVGGPGAPSIVVQDNKDKEVSDRKQMQIIRPGGLEPRLSYTNKIFDYSRAQHNYKHNFSVGSMDTGRRNKTSGKAWCSSTQLMASYPWEGGFEENELIHEQYK